MPSVKLRLKSLRAPLIGLEKPCENCLASGVERDYHTLLLLMLLPSSRLAINRYIKFTFDQLPEGIVVFDIFSSR